MPIGEDNSISKFKEITLYLASCIRKDANMSDKKRITLWIAKVCMKTGSKEAIRRLKQIISISLADQSLLLCP